MAILQSALVEPLLSRQRTAVIRDIARAAQLNEALIQVLKIDSAIVTETTASSSPQNYTRSIQDYLKAEITRVLMQIKIPATTVGDQKADTNAPGKTKVVASPQ